MPSTAIRHMNYDALEKVLQVEFVSGAIYDYFDVPQRVYEDFISAPSHGKFFAHHFRDKFAFRKKRDGRARYYAKTSAGGLPFSAKTIAY